MTAGMSETPQRWPYWTLFFCGHFGRATPASRRLNRETLLGLALLGGCAMTAALVDSVSPIGRWILVPGAALSVLWILGAFRRYFAELDELSLRIQHEAIAFAFSAMLLLGIAAATIAIVAEVDVHPLWIVVAEPLRGVGLVRAARRYQ
jgi:hypothetical protein